MKYTLACLVFYLASIIPAIALAKDDDLVEYDFEMIIFEETSGRYANSEKWDDSLLKDMSSSDPAAASRNVQTPSDPKFRIRPIKGIGLGWYARKLNENKRYHVLVHKAWRQAGLPEDQAVSIPIDSAAGNRSAETGDGSRSNRIYGSVKVVLSRYLHFYTDLLYQQPRDTTLPVEHSKDSDFYKNYPIKLHRRMRSKELHYLDHPIVGILIKALPVESAEDDNLPG